MTHAHIQRRLAVRSESWEIRGVLRIARGSKTGNRIVVGCMVATSLAMAPAMLPTQAADFVDLDGGLLLARDRRNALVYR